MKRLLLLTALLPFVGFAQPINTLNNPNQPGYQIPSQQRMQTQMQTQQIQQKFSAGVAVTAGGAKSRPAANAAQHQRRDVKQQP